jgi:hypothetical protein
MVDRDELIGLTDDDLRDRVDEWADEWADSRDVGYALAGRDLIYEVCRRWQVSAAAGSVTPEKRHADPRCILTSLAAGQPAERCEACGWTVTITPPDDPAFPTVVTYTPESAAFPIVNHPKGLEWGRLLDNGKLPERDVDLGL